MSQRSLLSLRVLTRLSISAPRAPFPSPRPFSQTPLRPKKRKIASSSPPHDSSPRATDSSSSSSSTDSSTAPDPENPLDLSSLTTSYAAADAHFRAELQQALRSGGGNGSPDADFLNSIPVTIRSSDNHIFQLREVAQVVPRSGRTVSLLVNDRKHIKDVMAAIQRSPDLNQQPQRSDDNELELTLRLQPPRPDDVARKARDACQGWRDRIRQARTRHEKTLHEWRRAKVVLPDVIKKVEREVQKLQDKKLREIDHEESQALKQLERR